MQVLCPPSPGRVTHRKLKKLSAPLAYGDAASKTVAILSYRLCMSRILDKCWGKFSKTWHTRSDTRILQYFGLIALLFRIIYECKMMPLVFFHILNSWKYLLYICVVYLTLKWVFVVWQYPLDRWLKGYCYKEENRNSGYWTHNKNRGWATVCCVKWTWLFSTHTLGQTINQVSFMLVVKNNSTASWICKMQLVNPGTKPTPQAELVVARISVMAATYWFIYHNDQLILEKISLLLPEKHVK